MRACCNMCGAVVRCYRAVLPFGAAVGYCRALLPYTLSFFSCLNIDFARTCECRRRRDHYCHHAHRCTRGRSSTLSHLCSGRAIHRHSPHRLHNLPTPRSHIPARPAARTHARTYLLTHARGGTRRPARLRAPHDDHRSQCRRPPSLPACIACCPTSGCRESQRQHQPRRRRHRSQGLHRR